MSGITIIQEPVWYIIEERHDDRSSFHILTDV